MRQNANRILVVSCKSWQRNSESVFLQESCRGHQVVVHGPFGIVFGPQVITKAKQVGAHQFVHVGFLAGACEQTEFVGLAANCFLRAVLDAKRFQVGIYGGANCYARIGSLFNGVILGKG